MGKRIVVFIIVLVLAGIVSAGAAAGVMLIEGLEAEIAVLSDLHIVADSYYTDAQTFEAYSKRDKMIHLSEAIAKTVVDSLIKEKRIKYVLVTGDLTEAGDYASHRAAAAILKKLVDAGKKVFVINGNHDEPGTESEFPDAVTVSQFREIYGALGYDGALKKDAESLSYTADINKKLRLIAVDNDNYFNADTGTNKEEMDDRLIGWVKGELEQCKKDGKTPVVIAHKPLLNDHFPPLVENFMGALGHSAGGAFNKLAEVMLDNGVNYLFVGHGHIMDITTLKNDEGKTLFEIETGSTIFYPSAYRVLTLTKDEFRLNTRYINRVNTDYISGHISETELDFIKSDFRGYAENHYKIGMTFLKNLGGTYLVQRLKLKGAAGEAVRLIADEGLAPLFSLPLYKKDAGDGISIEEIANRYGKELPSSNLKDVKDVAAQFIMAICRGDENISKDGVEAELLLYSVKALLYLIDGITGEIQEIFPGSPGISIDIEKLFGAGELEVIDSGIIDFALSILGGMLPIPGGITLEDLTVIKLLLPLINGLTENFIEDLGTKLANYLGDKEIYFDLLYNEFLVGELIADLINDEGDNNIVLKRADYEEVSGGLYSDILPFFN